MSCPALHVNTLPPAGFDGISGECYTPLCREEAWPMKKYLPSLVMFAVFETVAVGLWLAKGNPFYLWNFTYIGGCISLGLALFAAGRPWARQFVQWAVGCYLLFYLGIACRENLQIEGFWYYLFLGSFEAATIHYAVAKIGGPLLFGRGWCGYACWTAMVLDVLPWRQRESPRKNLGFLRYLTFAFSLAVTAGLFLSKPAHLERIMFWLFLGGNLVYYITGVLLAWRLRDNRAFCKYLCPITVFLKPMSRFSLLRVHCDETVCIQCGSCETRCPFGVAIRENMLAAAEMFGY